MPGGNSRLRDADNKEAHFEICCAHFEPSLFMIRVSTSLLKSFTFLGQTCTRNYTFPKNTYDPNLKDNAMIQLGIQYK